MGFLDEVETLIQALPYKRQTMLFSATMPAEVKRLAAAYTRDAEDVVIKGEKSPVPLDHIRQIVVEVTDRTKQEALISMIDTYRPFLAIIFCRTKRRASTLNEALLEQGYNSDELHGDLSQAKREAVMKRFREAKLQLLVATDVAARGLDVEGVTHVFNYDIPHDVESYIHRIGRTGRAGEKGMAITLVAPKDKGELASIEQHIQYNIERRRYDKGAGITAAGTKLRAIHAERDERGRGGRDGGRGEGRPRRDDRPARAGGEGRSARGEAKRARGAYAGSEAGAGGAGAGRSRTGAAGQRDGRSAGGGRGQAARAERGAPVGGSRGGRDAKRSGTGRPSAPGGRGRSAGGRGRRK
ncbi:hypothetical protein BGX30_005867 [Mortierella sp. GBA39]|nr:hypothetical protein BGX30_005867 [Mortierella sp. GBA39]